MEFKKIRRPEKSFFDFLPEDWKVELLPQWIKLHATAEVYVIEMEEKVGCMGILFHGVLPDLSPLEKLAKPYFKQHIYIGYLYTLPEYRSQGLASRWISEVKKLYPQKNYWLAIEDLQLTSFYKAQGFKPYLSPVFKTIDSSEMILYCNNR